MDKSTLCYCIPDLQKLVHQVSLCGRYFLVYNLLEVTSINSTFYFQPSLQMVSLNSQLESISILQGSWRDRLYKRL